MTTMTPLTAESFAAIAALIDNLFKDDFDPGREAAYLTALVRVRPRITAEELEAAVYAIAGRPGGPFAPSPPQLVAEVHAHRHVGTAKWAQERIAALIGALCETSAAPRIQAAMWGSSIADPLFGRDLPLEAEHHVYGPILAEVLADIHVSQLTRPDWWRWHGRDLWTAATDRHGLTVPSDRPQLNAA